MAEGQDFKHLNHFQRPLAKCGPFHAAETDEQQEGCLRSWQAVTQISNSLGYSRYAEVER